MRIIKFRAKRSDDGAWVYGDLTHVQKICSVEEKNKTGKSTIPVVRVAGYNVDEETIGQFTGMYDSSGREIYEGDILTCKAGRFVVQIDTDAARFMVSPASLYDSVYVTEASFTLSYNSIAYWFSICGNIHENAELLN